MRKLGLATIVLVGCAHRAPRSPVLEAPSGPARMAVIAEGARDGYRVIHGCRQENSIGLIGDGAQKSDADEARLLAMRDRVLAALRRLHIDGSAGLGGACRDSVPAVVVALREWRTVAIAVDAIGRVLADGQATVTLPAASSSVDRVPASVRTAEGAYDGYRVLRGCRHGSTAIGVVGRGSHPFAGPPDESSRPSPSPDGARKGDDARYRALVARMVAELKPIPAAHGVGIGGACVERIPALHIYVEEWAAMDEVIAAVGSFFAREGLAEEAVLMQAGRPTLDGSADAAENGGEEAVGVVAVRK